MLGIVYSTYAQVLPEPGAKLNYTQVMFEYEKVKDAEQYIVQITEDATGGTFNHPFIQQKDSSTATIISHLQFGKKYLWRYAGIVKGKTQNWKGPYNFETLEGAGITDDNAIRVSVLKNDSTENSLGLITLDHACCIIDREGNIVWFLPGVKVISAKIGTLRDLRVTPSGTITTMALTGPKEYDLAGHVLWAAPTKDEINDDTLIRYHHDFKKLPNGHYMVLDNKPDWITLPADFDTANLNTAQTMAAGAMPAGGINAANGGIAAAGPNAAGGGNAPSVYLVQLRSVEGRLQGKVEFGAIIEFDKNGKVVWSWNSKDYLKAEDIFPPNTKLRPTDSEFGPHMNAFDIDSNNEFVYAGFRNISRVVKIEKKTGAVVYSWGKLLPSGEARDGHDYFRYQHDSHIFSDGSIGVFDNEEMLEKENPSRVVIFTQPQKNELSKIKWKFDCVFDSVITKSIRGGNVEEIKKDHFLVCMGVENRVFEITYDKKIVWSVRITKPRPRESGYGPFPLYRTHYTSSLYPCYFTIQSDKDILNGASSFNLKIFNEGTEDDQYTVNISSSSKSFSKQINVQTIGAGRSLQFTVNPDKPTSPNDKLEVTVRSVTNPDFVRQIVLEYQK